MAGKAELRGVLAAVITPFTDDGAEVDVDGLKRHANHLLETGCHGLIPGGSTGEFTSLSHAERKLVHSVVVAAADGRVPVYPQTGAMTTREAVELSSHAESIGADGVMVAPPYYDPLTFAELKSYYAAVAGAITIPLMIYNIPSATGQHLSAAQIGELAEIPGVTSVKDSSGDAAALSELLEVYGDRVQVCNGGDTLTFFALAAGATAIVLGAANVFPEVSVELFEALATRGDLSAARAIWRRIYPLLAFFEQHSYAARVKTACGLLGRPVGPTRLPLHAPGDNDRGTLAALLERAHLAVTPAGWATTVRQPE